mgnify:CR=1 FL=1
MDTHKEVAHQQEQDNKIIHINMATTIYSFQADLKQLLKLNSELDRANVSLKELKANTAAYAAQSKKIGTISKSMQKNANSMRGANQQALALNRTGNKMVAIFKSASIAIVSAFAFRAIIGGLRGVISSFADFESQMAAVKAISGATDGEFKKLNDTALELGKTTVFTARQVAELQEEYARLGFTADEIVKAQQGTIALAAATGESLKSSAETSGAVLRAFGLDAADTGRVVDIMGASFTSSALNLERFRESMKFVAPVAKAAGFTLEETSAMLAKLADNGLHGSIAGNALKNIMLRLGDANSKLNQNLGRTVQGLPQFTEALREMKNESFGLTEATELLDKRSAPAFLVLLNSIEGLEGQLDTLVQAEGTVSQMSQIRLDTLEGDFTLLKSATEGLGVAIGSVFENSLRQSIYSLTQWVQGIANSEKTMTRLRGAFGILQGVITALITKWAIMKTLSIGTLIDFKGLAKGVRLLTISLRGAATQTMTLSTAMKGLRAAMASTGVGLLVVGLGALVGWLTKSKDAISDVVHQSDRMLDSFEKDVQKITELNFENTERVDLLRKLNQDYPELVENIDLEIASNEQLVDILKTVNSTRAERNLIADKNKEIDQIFETLRLEELRDSKKILALKNERDQLSKNLDKYGKIELQSAKRMRDIDEETTRLRVNMITREKNAKKQEAIILKDIEFFQKSIDEKKKASSAFRDLEEGDEGDFRMVLRNGYLSDLEDFREIGILKESERKKMNAKQINDWVSQAKIRQEILIDEAKAERDKLKKVQRYHELNSKMGKGSQKEQKILTKELNNFYKTLGKGEREELANYPESLNKVGIRVQELRTFITNLSSALIKSGPAADKSAISVTKLENTKNRIKELLKVETEGIADIDQREKSQLDNSFKYKIEKYQKEDELIKTNLQTITDYQTGLAENQDELNKEFIIKNRNKYHVLKTIDKVGWEKLMAETNKGIKLRLEALSSMQKEEQEKAQTNMFLLDALQAEHDRNTAIMENEQFARRNNAAKESLKLEMAVLNDGAMSLFRSNKEFKKQMREINENDLLINQANLDNGLISEEEHAANVLKINKDLSDQLNALEDQRLNKAKEVYSQIASVIMDISANRAAVESQRVEEQAAKDMQIEQDKFDRQLEIAEQAGRDTEGMQKKHDIKMKDIEEQKQSDLREIARKQFMMKKANDIIMATINGALAITKVTAQTGIGAIAAAPLTSALVAAQIAAIASQKFVGKKGGLTPSIENQGTLEINKFAEGGMVHGPSHAEGGVKFASGGRVVELEGGEAVINKRSTALFKPMLSQMNSHNGYGKKFAQGGMTPGTTAIMGQAMENWTARDIAGLVSDSINSQQVFVTEADVSSSQSVVDIIEAQSTIF